MQKSLMTLALILLCCSMAVGADLDAVDIVQRATQAAGGDDWRLARSIRLKGHATLYRGGQHPGMDVDSYRMLRIYPRELDDANTASGRFRLDAKLGERLIFVTSFDGQHMYDRRGRVEDDEGARRAAGAFGYSAIRFALHPDFSLERLADDAVDGHDSHFVRVIDPSGGATLFGIDSDDYSIRLVGWQTPEGWHHRIYSDFYTIDGTAFRQPGRVRLYNDGVKSVDIRWTSAELDVDLPDGLFQLESTD